MRQGIVVKPLLIILIILISSYACTAQESIGVDDINEADKIYNQVLNNSTSAFYALGASSIQSFIFPYWEYKNMFSLNNLPDSSAFTLAPPKKMVIWRYWDGKERRIVSKRDFFFANNQELFAYAVFSDGDYTINRLYRNDYGVLIGISQWRNEDVKQSTLTKFEYSGAGRIECIITDGAGGKSKIIQLCQDDQLIYQYYPSPESSMSHALIITNSPNILTMDSTVFLNNSSSRLIDEVLYFDNCVSERRRWRVSPDDKKELIDKTVYYYKSRAVLQKIVYFNNDNAELNYIAIVKKIDALGNWTMLELIRNNKQIDYIIRLIN
ncbi:hypothetical protein SDC9_130830 [bioreactor metagenome]|jgi:hypothetical protein|uniref:Uncharacterized protein n=1 Tax=bioreactor metagenome TaxID=1076179 RepID=A0A645D3M2_9ZZZZ